MIWLVCRASHCSLYALRPSERALRLPSSPYIHIFSWANNCAVNEDTNGVDLKILLILSLGKMRIVLIIVERVRKKKERVTFPMCSDNRS